MQDALRKQQQQQAQREPDQARQETSEQRERRIANQAQLQRVPDDPGALLRMKFRLEYERRQGIRR
jgi:Ca-activated chloride channel family protein